MIKFSDVRDRILFNLMAKDLELDEDLLLIDGFFNPSISKMSERIELTETTVPMIMCVGKESGQVFFFSAKMLMEEEARS
jgi:hypothetical protein